MAGEGLPAGGGVGFEIFDTTGFGVSEFTQKINYVRATQGELARTIGWLTEIDTARVHIVMPEKRLFASDQDQTRASIVLKVIPGRRLNSGQVQGIVHLVASSVAGLSPQNVTIVDTGGKMLTKAMDDESGSALTSSQLEYQRSLESDMEGRIQSILEPVVGEGNVIARVSAEVDFTRIEKTEERFDPDGVVVRSEQKSVEKSTGGAMAAGVPGVLSNTPGEGDAQVVKSNPAGSQRQNEVINYEISKVVSKTILPSGIIKKLSISVLLNSKNETTTTDEGEVSSSYVARTEDEMKKFEGLIKGAIGFTSERGDTVAVINIPFESKADLSGMGEIKEEGMIEAVKGYIPYMIRYGTIIFLSIILFLFVLRPLINGIVKGGGGVVVGGPATDALPEALRALEQGIGQKAIAPTTEMKEKVIELARESPQQAAQIIKAWVKER